LRDGSSGPEMVSIPPGESRTGDIQGSGDADEQPMHSVRIPRPFAMGRYEVTFDEYNVFARATEREQPADKGWGRGRTRRGRARRTCGSGVTIRHRRVNMPTCLTSAIRRNLAQDTRYRGNRMIARTHILRSRRWAPSTRTPGGCMTCWEMCGSGCRIVTITITKVHQPTVQRGRRRDVPCA
jgi:hypothetical protein